MSGVDWRFQNSERLTTDQSIDTDNKPTMNEEEGGAERQRRALPAKIGANPWFGFF
jgi:hypothetical protein